MSDRLSDTELQSLIFNKNEGTIVDFKREQYQFIDATEKDKSKLLKDILAFANSSRETEAYIIIGIEEKEGKADKIVGCEEHLHDANLQQFVNGKTNKKVILSYEVYPIENKKIGIIRIPKQQRPIYVNKDFGDVKQEKVYFRLGSSNTDANPQDIYNMGKDDAKLNPPILDLQFFDIFNKTKIGHFLRLNRIAFDEPVNELPNANIPTKSDIIIDPNYWRLLEENIRLSYLTFPIRFAIYNQSYILAQNIHIEIIDESVNVITFVDSDYFDHPPSYDYIENWRNGFYPNPFTDVKDEFRKKNKNIFINITDTHWTLKIKVGDIKPQETCYTDIVFIGAKETIDLKIKAKIYGNNLPEPQIFDLNIDFNVKKLPSLTIENLRKLKNVPNEIQ